MHRLFCLISFMLVIMLAGCEKKADDHPHPEPVGGDCESIGAEPCTCPDGTARCSDREGNCPCEPPAGDAVSFPAGDMPCNEDSVAAINRWAGAYFGWRANVVPYHGDLTPVAIEQPGAPVLAPPVTLSVSADSASLNGEATTLDDLEAAHTKLVEQRQQEAKASDATWTHPGLVVVFDAATPWARVFAVMSKLPVLKTGPLYLGFGASKPDPALQGRVNAARGTDAAQERHDAALAECKAMGELLEAVDRAAPADRGQLLIEKLGPVWRTCECAPDIERIATTLSRVPGQPMAIVPLKLGSGAVLSAAGDRPWRDTYRRFLDSEGPVQLTISTSQ